jgi:hypothetical protein
MDSLLAVFLSVACLVSDGDLLGDCVLDDPLRTCQTDFSDASVYVRIAYDPALFLQAVKRLRNRPLPALGLPAQPSMRGGLTPSNLGQYCGQIFSAPWGKWWLSSHIKPPPFPLS